MPATGDWNDDFERKLREQAGVNPDPQKPFNFEPPQEGGAMVEAPRQAPKDKRMVEAAFGFIGLCNQYQMPKTVAIMGPEGGMGPAPMNDADDNYLPAPQQQAYNYACQFVMEYFKHGCSELPGHPEIGPFNPKWGIDREDDDGTDDVSGTGD